MKPTAHQPFRNIDRVFAAVLRSPVLSPPNIAKYLDANESRCVKVLTEAGAWDANAGDIKDGVVIPRIISANRKNSRTTAILLYLYHACLCLGAGRRLKTMIMGNGLAIEVARAATMLTGSLAEMQRAPTGKQLREVLREHEKNTRSANLYLVTKAAFKGGRTNRRLGLHGAYQEAAAAYPKDTINPAKSAEALRSQVLKWRKEGYL